MRLSLTIPERLGEPLGAYLADAFTALLSECPDYLPKHQHGRRGE